MGGKNKKNKKPQAVVPYIKWEVKHHVIEQAIKKQIAESAWRLITNGEVEVTAVRKHDDKCETCKHYKFFYMTKNIIEGVTDCKVIGCGNCKKFITVYLNERSFGNTPIHPYQRAQGMTQYPYTCRQCGFRTNITLAEDTQEKVNEKIKHECRGAR